MAGDGDGFADGIGLAQAIALLRAGLLEARAAAADSDIQLPVESMTVELQVVATRTREGKAGFAVPFVNAELGGRQVGNKKRCRP
jgi:NTP-dependent ternary system trypsin peptidase co-occuring protein